MTAICEQLIAAATKDAAPSAVRVDDVFALMVEFHHSVGDEPAAHAAMQRMAQSGIVLGPYLDAAMIDEICGAVGADPRQLLARCRARWCARWSRATCCCWTR